MEFHRAAPHSTMSKLGAMILQALAIFGSMVKRSRAQLLNAGRTQRLSHVQINQLEMVQG